MFNHNGGWGGRGDCECRRGEGRCHSRGEGQRGPDQEGPRGFGGHHRHHGRGPGMGPGGMGPMGPEGMGPEGMSPGAMGPGMFGRFAMPAAFFGRGPAVRRGDVRSALLGLLQDGPMHGYQAIQELTKRSGGAWRPSAGSIYPTLQQLEDEGLVTSEEREGRRTYRLTETGTAAAQELPTGSERWGAQTQGAPEAGPAVLRPIVFQLGAAVMQVAQVGTPEAIEAARGILERARRDIYRLLAEEPAGTSEPVEDAGER